jgi:hypothetical protein
MKQKLWCCVRPTPNETYYELESLSYTKHLSILFFEREGAFEWKEFKKRGWKCIRVEVEIKPI